MNPIVALLIGLLIGANIGLLVLELLTVAGHEEDKWL